MANNGGQDYTPRFSRLLLEEKYNSSKQGGDASFRVLYYGGGAGSVPFMWESQPGTPKHTFNDDPLPPLTPPPYYCSSPRTNSPQKKHSKNSKILNSIFPRVPSRKINAASFSAPPTPINNLNHRFEDEYDVGIISPSSTLCFGTKSGSPAAARRFRGYSYPIKSVKKVVLSIVGQGKVN